MYDVIVIGSGPGGYVAAIRAAQLGLKTACVEKDPVLGGTCLNVGCIPSKSLLYSSEFYEKIKKQSKSHGIEIPEINLNFDTMQSRKQKIVTSFNTGIKFLFQKNKIDPIEGLASFISPEEIRVKDQTFKAKNFILATGSEPTPLPFLPFDEKKVVSSTGALALKSIPKKMIVVGAGIIGVELGSVYRRLGSDVQFIEFLDHICPTLDKGISKAFYQILSSQGLKFSLSSKVIKGSIKENGVEISYMTSEGKEEIVNADIALISIGRKPFTQGLYLEKAGIKVDSKGFIPIDRAFRTQTPHIYAIGDVIGGSMLAHKASEEGIAVAELIAGQKTHMEYISIPSVVYTNPEAAAVGLTEEQAKSLSLSIKVGQFPFKANSRARCTGEEEGLIKIIAEEKTGIILGIHIIGAHAGELIEEGGLAIEKKVTAFELSNLSHAHPTLSEAMKEAALMIAKKAIHL